MKNTTYKNVMQECKMHEIKEEKIVLELKNINVDTLAITDWHEKEREWDVQS